MASNEYSESFPRVEDEADPDRCQGIIKSKGQCLNKSLPHSDYCPAHGGNKGEEAHEKKQANNYRLQKWKWKVRLGELSESDVIKSLREEIGILRVLMEERLVRIEDPSDLILQSGPISDLVMKIDKVVNSCHKLEGSMGQLLDKSKVIQLANEFIEIISSELPDNPETVEKIADRVLLSIANSGNEDEE
jgi:hypothetical protein